MDINKILTADILDIIFEGRNKEYGAYELRKTYNKRLITAVVSMLAICLLVFLSTILAKVVAPKKQTQILVQDVQLATGVPVLFGVVTVENLDQAMARSEGPGGHNVGEEAAMGAVEMARLAQKWAPFRDAG